MYEWWENYGKSVKSAALFVAVIIIGGCGLAFLLN